MKAEYKTLKQENRNLKDSNQNHVFINEKLNQALKKATSRLEEFEKMGDSIKTQTTASDSLKVKVEEKEEEKEMEFGDVSSIMIKPDQLYNNFGEEEEK